MDKKEKREQAIQSITEMLRKTSFQVEFEVTEKPKGIRVVCEVTQKQMDSIIKNSVSKLNN